MSAPIDISITPDELETWDLVPDGTVGALDLAALTLADTTGWRITIELPHGVTLTAAPATASNGDPS